MGYFSLSVCFLLHYLETLFYFAIIWPPRRREGTARQEVTNCLDLLAQNEIHFNWWRAAWQFAFSFTSSSTCSLAFPPPVPDLPSLLLKLLSCKIERTAGRIKNETWHHERTNLEEGHCCWLHLKRRRQSVSHVGPGKVRKSRDEDQR